MQCAFPMRQCLTHAALLLLALFGFKLVEGGTVTSISFSMVDQQCFVGNRDARVVISFTPATTLALGGTITLNYPTGFFNEVAPVVISGAVVMSATAPDSLSNTITLTITTGSIAASAPFTMTLAGLTIQKIPSGSVNSVWLTTSTDLGTPQSVSTGNCFQGSWSGTCEQLAGLRNSNNSPVCSRSACVQRFTFEFYVGIVRRTFKGFSDPSCYSATSSDTLLPFIHSSEATPCTVKDTQSIAGFFPGQNILTITMAPDRVGCLEIWTNGSHFLEQGNQKTDSRNYQTTTACPLCRNCASVSAACAGRCSVGGSLQCSDPLPLGAGPIDWNYRCYGRRDTLNDLQRFLTDEFEVGLTSWKKNKDGTLNQEWFVSQVAKVFSISSDLIVVLETRIDFFNVAVEEFSVPASDQGASDRGLIVSFMVAREYREAIESKLLLGGFRLVLRRYINAITIRLRPALATSWQKWQRLEPLKAADSEEKDTIFPIVLFVACAAVGMIPRAFWRAFPALVRKLSAETQKAAGKAAHYQPGDEIEDDDEDDEEEG